MSVTVERLIVMLQAMPQQAMVKGLFTDGNGESIDEYVTGAHVEEDDDGDDDTETATPVVVIDCQTEDW